MSKEPGAREAHANARAGDRARSDLYPAHRSARWLATLFLALLAFTWQSFVAQTHAHPIPGGYPATLTGQAVGPALIKAGQSPSDQPASCPICQEIAHAGNYLLPGSVAFLVPQSVVGWYVVTPSPTPAPRQRSHAWQSRAPPHQLQA